MTAEQPREATWEERATWGTCPVCHAESGQWCIANIGVQLGFRVDGLSMKTGEGAHLARLRSAPMMVKMVAA